MELLLGIHILGGSIALLSAAVAVVTKKGGKQHRRFGKYYTAGRVMHLRDCSATGITNQ